MKLIAALTVSVSLLAQSGQPAPHSVTAVRHWSLAEVTRVAIEVTGEFEFRTDRLHNPERVYYDILNAAPLVGGRRSFTEAVDDPLLLRIRVAETVPGIARVVLDLGGAVEATTSTLTNPNRLVVELRHGTGLAIPTEPPAAEGLESHTGKSAADPHTGNAGAVEPSPPPPLAVKPEQPAVKPPAKSPAPRADVYVPGITPPPPPKPEPPPPATTEETGKAARHTSSGQNSLIRALGLKINRVVIDPGHGGHDQGTEGPKGLLEKDLVLDVAKRLGKLVEDRMGAEVVFTRTDDTFVPLEGRTALANEKKADLFLSIHANSSSIPRIAGVETFYLNIRGTQDAMDVAARENATAQKSIFELQDIIQKITLHDKSTESLEFARRIQAALFAFSARNVPTAKDRGVKSAPFVVLIGASMPSVLAEIGFLSNPREETLLKKSDYRDKLADALYKGMERYTQSLSHFQIAARP